jgi:hypothetical protein
MVAEALAAKVGLGVFVVVQLAVGLALNEAVTVAESLAVGVGL